jgi:hypothetical protein
MAKLCEQRTCYRTFPSFSVLAMSTRYSRSEFLNTSETIEFILDFSTGMRASETLRIAIVQDWGIGLFSEKGFLSL